MKIIKKNKKTMIVNATITIATCAIGFLVVEYFDLPELTYIAVGMLAGAVEVDIA